MTEVPWWDQGCIVFALYISAGKNPITVIYSLWKTRQMKGREEINTIK